MVVHWVFFQLIVLTTGHLRRAGTNSTNAVSASVNAALQISALQAHVHHTDPQPQTTQRRPGGELINSSWPMIEAEHHRHDHHPHDGDDEHHYNREIRMSEDDQGTAPFTFVMILDCQQKHVDGSPSPIDFDIAVSQQLIHSGNRVYGVCMDLSVAQHTFAHFFSNVSFSKPQAEIMRDADYVLWHAWDLCAAESSQLATGSAWGNLSTNLSHWAGFFEGYGNCKITHLSGILRQVSFLGRSSCTRARASFPDVTRVNVLQTGWGFDDCAGRVGVRQIENRVCFLGQYRDESYLRTFCDIAKILPDHTFLSFVQAGLRRHDSIGNVTHCTADNIEWMSQDKKKSLGPDLVNSAVASCSVHLDFAWSKGYRSNHPTTKALHALACGAVPVVEAFSEFEELGSKYGETVRFGASASQWAHAIRLAGAKHKAKRQWFAEVIPAHQTWQRVSKDYVGLILAENVGATCSTFPPDLPEFGVLKSEEEKNEETKKKAKKKNVTIHTNTSERQAKRKLIFARPLTLSEPENMAVWKHRSESSNVTSRPETFSQVEFRSIIQRKGAWQDRPNRAHEIIKEALAIAHLDSQTETGFLRALRSLQATNTTNATSATSGSVFSGDRVRTADGDDNDTEALYRFANLDAQFACARTHSACAHLDNSTNFNRSTIETSSFGCNSSHWAVVTTIQCPSKLVRQLLTQSDACVVIIGDRSGPDSSSVCMKELEENTRVMFASAELQEVWGSNTFVRSLPWKHFSRKNLGYLIAISQGAEYIWDVDDDNFLKDGADPFDLPRRSASYAAISNYSCLGLSGYSVNNPYILYGCHSCWPRGFPLSCVKNHTVVPGLSNATLAQESSVEEESVDTKAVVVWQSLADGDPDVDAIQRLMNHPPSRFNPNRETTVMRKNVYVPYNAQATLHHRDGFWALLLPRTVHGRVSDIWRSYLSERLFWDCALEVAFTSPVVQHERNSHDIRGDFSAEWPLYTQTEALLKILSEIPKTGTSVEARMKNAWRELYERSILEKEDLDLVATWWITLRNLGYKAPDC